MEDLTAILKNSTPNMLLAKLISNWANYAQSAFLNSDKARTDFGREFIMHGGICYFNCASQLRRLITTGQVDVLDEENSDDIYAACCKDLSERIDNGNFPANFYLQILKKNSKRP